VVACRVQRDAVGCILNGITTIIYVRGEKFVCSKNKHAHGEHPDNKNGKRIFTVGSVVFHFVFFQLVGGGVD
jgi:hypothetical protein